MIRLLLRLFCKTNAEQPQQQTQSSRSNSDQSEKSSEQTSEHGNRASMIACGTHRFGAHLTLMLLAIVGSSGTKAIPIPAAPSAPTRLWHSLGEQQLEPGLAHQHERPVPLGGDDLPGEQEAHYPSDILLGEQEEPGEQEQDPAQQLVVVGGAAGSVGPAWTRGELEPPAGEKDMGGWTATTYSSQQQQQLGVDENGQLVDNNAAPLDRDAVATAGITATDDKDSNIGGGGDFREQFMVIDRPLEYPEHWGEPPTFGTMDVRELPGGYGTGSSTLVAWIQRHLDLDADLSAAPPPADRLAGYVGAGKLEGFPSHTGSTAALGQHEPPQPIDDEKGDLRTRVTGVAAAGAGKPPKGCVTWYDGCNDCAMRRGQLVCTRIACFTQANPFCKMWRDGRRCTSAEVCD